MVSILVISRGATGIDVALAFVAGVVVVAVAGINSVAVVITVAGTVAVVVGLQV